MKKNTDFYSEIKPIKDFNELINIRKFSRVPDDWYIIITDVVSSTSAIEAGMYKTVNTVGALAIVAILNLTQGFKIPFIFGGDGATILIPPIFLEDAKSVLLDTVKKAKEDFNLDLRLGFVSVSYINNKGKDLFLGKYEVSSSYFQAIILGGAVSYAERIVKSGKFNINSSLSSVKADFTGFECRWNNVPSPKEETISLIVEATGSNKNIIYSEILYEIDNIFGNTKNRNPINHNQLSLSIGKELIVEGMVFHRNTLDIMLTYLKLFFINMFQSLFSRNSLLNFKKRIIDNIDYQKFDDSLKMVISGNKEDRELLIKYLNSLYEKKKVFFGIHQSESALMTCLVFQKEGEQVHFVDSADGGYALASKQLKKQKKAAL